MKQLVISCVTILSCLICAACGSSVPMDASYHYKEEKTALTEQSLSYEDFSKEYGKLYDYYVDENQNAVFLYGTREPVSYHVVSYNQENEEYELLSMNPSDNPAVCKITTAPDGSIVLLDTVRAYFYHPKEEEPFADIPAWLNGGMIFADSDTVICQAYGDSAYFSYDLHTGKQTGTYLEKDFLLEKGKYQPFLYAQGNQLFLITGAGLYEYLNEAWSLQVPSEKTSLSKPGFEPCRIEKNEDGSYYVYDAFFQYHYFLTETDESIQPVTIRISAWQDRYTLKSAIAEYQIEHPEVTIEYTFQCVDEPTNTQEMNSLIQKMNLEVTGSSPADIYVLDKLPWEDYLQKGYLEDISKLMEPYQEDGDIFGNVLGAYEDNGTAYAVPWFFTTQAVICRKEMVPYVSDIHSLAEYLDSNPDVPGLVPYFYQNRPDIFLARMYEVYGKDLMVDGSYTKESILEFLRDAQTIYNRLQRNDQAALPDYPVRYGDMSQFPVEELYLLWEKQEGSMAVLPLTPMNMDCLAQLSHHSEYSAVPVGGLQGQFLFGIHSSSSQKEEAGKLLAFLMNYFQEYGKSDASISMFSFLPGLPVSKQTLDDNLLRWEESESSKDFETVTVNGEEEYPFYHAQQEDITRIHKLLSEYHTRGLAANALTDKAYGVFEERSQGYLTGEKSIEEAADEVYQGLSLLEKEKG